MCVLGKTGVWREPGFWNYSSLCSHLNCLLWSSHSLCLQLSFLNYKMKLNSVVLRSFLVLHSLWTPWLTFRTPWLWLCLETWLCLPEGWPAAGGLMASRTSLEISTRKSTVNSLHFSVNFICSFFLFPTLLLSLLFFSLPPCLLPLSSTSSSPFLLPPTPFSSLLKNLSCPTSLLFFFFYSHPSPSSPLSLFCAPPFFLFFL